MRSRFRKGSPAPSVRAHEASLTRGFATGYDLSAAPPLMRTRHMCQLCQSILPLIESRNISFSFSKSGFRSGTVSFSRRDSSASMKSLRTFILGSRSSSRPDRLRVRRPSIELHRNGLGRIVLYPSDREERSEDVEVLFYTDKLAFQKFSIVVVELVVKCGYRGIEFGVCVEMLDLRSERTTPSAEAAATPPSEGGELDPATPLSEGGELDPATPLSEGGGLDSATPLLEGGGARVGHVESMPCA